MVQANFLREPQFSLRTQWERIFSLFSFRAFCSTWQGLSALPHTRVWQSSGWPCQQLQGCLALSDESVGNLVQYCIGFNLVQYCIGFNLVQYCIGFNLVQYCTGFNLVQYCTGFDLVQYCFVFILKFFRGLEAWVYVVGLDFLASGDWRIQTLVSGLLIKDVFWHFTFLKWNVCCHKIRHRGEILVHFKWDARRIG